MSAAVGKKDGGGQQHHNKKGQHNKRTFRPVFHSPHTEVPWVTVPTERMPALLEALRFHLAAVRTLMAQRHVSTRGRNRVTPDHLQAPDEHDLGDLSTLSLPVGLHVGINAVTRAMETGISSEVVPSLCIRHALFSISFTTLQSRDIQARDTITHTQIFFWSAR